MPEGSAVAGPAEASALALRKIVRRMLPEGPSMLLFLGDQVYVDATAGLFDPTVQDDPYKLVYTRQNQSLIALCKDSTVDVYAMPDDHEITDNWEPGDPASGVVRESSAKELGLSAYWKNYRLPEVFTGKFWRDDIVHGGLPFFLGDARTEREGRTAMNWREQKIMNDLQFTALRQWLAIPENANLPKFVSTASALLPRRLAVARDAACALHSDAWDGYPKSMHELLAHICDKQIKGLVFLSGDEHISNHVTARVTDLHTGRQCTFHSVHSSALYAPYPFANAVKEDFARSETFRFPDPPDPAAGRYCCEVRTVFAPEGDGFALLTALPPSISDGTDWQLKVNFHDANGPKIGGTHMLDLFP
jgi:cholesterol oxidase